VPVSGAIIFNGQQYSSISAFALAAARTVNPKRQVCDGWKEVRATATACAEGAGDCAEGDGARWLLP
jgi:hypothetical protein